MPNLECEYCGVTDDSLHARMRYIFFRNLVLTLVQMDELYTRIRRTASAAWLWLAFDPVSNLKRRFSARSPAMALDPTDHLWSVHDPLHHPVPPVV